MRHRNQNEISSTRDKCEARGCRCGKPCRIRVFSNHGESAAGGRSLLPGSSGVNNARRALSQVPGAQVDANGKAQATAPASFKQYNKTHVEIKLM